MWSYIAGTGQLAVDEIRRVQRRTGVDVLISPAVIYELLRSPNKELRDRDIDVVTRQVWKRMMPEAYSENIDLLDEVRRLRPEWLHKRPDLSAWRRHKADWQGGFWNRARKTPGAMAAVIAEIEGDTLDMARKQSAAARQISLENGATEATFKWNRATARFIAPEPGWDGEDFEAWRGMSCAHWAKSLLRGRQQTSLDWLAPWLDLPLIRRQGASWTTFWTREVDVVRLPREWIRWAMGEVQATRKSSRGTPGDNQLATYLFDCDRFATADKVFHDLARALAQHSPRPLAAPYLVKMASCVDDVVAAIESLDAGS